MLSLHTNIASNRIQSALGGTQQKFATSMTRLGTGYRINSASDDAAGLQIGTRLLSQSRGMVVAMQNTQNATSMLQTAEGAFAETENVLHRMRDLALQSADASYTQSDRLAMQQEYSALGSELRNVMAGTSYGGEKLLDVQGGTAKLGQALRFQIGDTSGETMTFDVSQALSEIDDQFKQVSAMYQGAGDPQELTHDAAQSRVYAMVAARALSAVSKLRGEIGAGQNRLSHIASNLSNMMNNTKDAEGQIRDVDYASETANMTKLSILQQAGGSMLTQSSKMSQLVLSLVQ
ncbi:flagellin [Burkholderia territorii]|uniref:flagellin N-terminal helical domain-containing protein n=1 Tax=Burkholderia territorii TaxID=1503055 RepID=UPI00075A341A|nr:flagellin [Burkholderia territorii]KWH08502.1 flagellin [Burkholderia territorii]